MPLTVYTWKSDSKHKSVYRKPLKALWSGTNVGHASIELTWPDDAQGAELANKYAGRPGIVISKRTEMIPEKTSGGDHQSEYRAKEQVVYFAYVSWWPGQTNGHHVNNRFRDDREKEWENDPEGKLKADTIEALYGEEGPSDRNKTTFTARYKELTLKGWVDKTTEVVKIREIAHSTLNTKDISSDPAWQQLEAICRNYEEKNIEYSDLLFKMRQGITELKEAKKQHRDPDPNLLITEEQRAWYESWMKFGERVHRQLRICEEDFQERHTSVGQTPTQVIALPTNTDLDAPHYCLDTEDILSQMAQMSESEFRYNLLSINCSTAVEWLLHYGIPKEVSQAMKEDGIEIKRQRFATPVSAARMAQQLQSELLHLNAHYVDNTGKSLHSADMKQRLREIKEESMDAVSYAADETDEVDKTNEVDDNNGNVAPNA